MLTVVVIGIKGLDRYIYIDQCIFNLFKPHSSLSERLLPLSSKSRGSATARNGKDLWKCFRLSGVKAGAHSIDDIKSAVFTFADDNPARTLLPLVCVFKSVQS